MNYRTNSNLDLPCAIAHHTLQVAKESFRQLISSLLSIAVLCQKPWKFVPQNRISQLRNSAILREMKFANGCDKCYFFAQKCSETKEKFCAFFLKSFANGNPTPYTGTMYIVYITFNCTCPDPQATSTAKVGSPRQDLGKHLYLCIFLSVCLYRKQTRKNGWTYQVFFSGIYMTQGIFWIVRIKKFWPKKRMIKKMESTNENRKFFAKFFDCYCF